MRAYVHACWKYAETNGHTVAGRGDIVPWAQRYRDAGGNPDEPASSASQPLPEALPDPPVSGPLAVPWPPPAVYPPLSPPPRPVREPRPGVPRTGRRKLGWRKLALGLLCLVGLVVVLASPGSPAPRPVPSPRTAWCAYVTALPALVLSAPSAGAAQVKSKDLGKGIEILPLPHPPGWWPVYTPRNRPGYNWMQADVLSPRVKGTRPCPDSQAVVAVTAYNAHTQEQFAVGSDCHVYHRWQRKPGGLFGQWEPLGGCAAAQPGLAVGKNGDGDLVAFVIWPDHTVRYRSQSSPGLGPWTGWTSLGGDFSSGLRVVSASSGFTSVKVFAKDGGGNLWEDETQANGAWRGWREV